MTCREHFWELWRRSHKFTIEDSLPEFDILYCGACDHQRVTKRKHT